MKHIKKTFSILFLILASTHIQSQDSANVVPKNNNGNNTIELIRENTYQTARHTEKGKIDYIALGASLFASLIAFITLYFSIRTYRSQKRTEQNTLRWSAKMERANLRRIMFNLFCHYRKLLAIEKLIADGQRPAPSCFENMKIDINELHLNENFGEGLGYSHLYVIAQLLNRFNTLIDTRIAQTQNASYKWETDLYKPFNLSVTDGFEELEVISYTLEAIDKAYPTMFERKERDKLNLTEKKQLIRNYTDFSYLKQNADMMHIDSEISRSQREDYQGVLKTNFDSFLGLLDVDLCDQYWESVYLIFIAHIRENMNYKYEDIRQWYEAFYKEKDLDETFEFLTKPNSLYGNPEIDIKHELPFKEYHTFYRKILLLFKWDSFAYDWNRISDILPDNPLEIKDKLDVFDFITHTYYTQVTRDEYISMMNPTKEMGNSLTIQLEKCSLIALQLLEKKNIQAVNKSNGEVSLRPDIIQFLSIMYISVDFKDSALFRIKDAKLIAHPVAPFQYSISLTIAERVSYTRQ